MEFQPHSKKQNDALFSTAKITVVGTGIQWGKTSIGAVRMKMKMHTYTEPDDAFLITAPTYKILEQSTLPAFLKIMQGCGVYKAGNQIFDMYGGGTCYFRTNTDPDSIVGITNVRHEWGDEAGKFSLYFWENMQGRASFKDCQIDLTTSPYTLNWLHKEIIKPKMRDPSARPDVLLVRARSDENPYFPKDEYERRRLTMDPRRFGMIYGGSWGKMAGLVYGCFDEVANVVEPYILPTGTRVVAAIDWGYTNPCAIVVRGITPAGYHDQLGEHYQAQMTIDQIIAGAKKMREVYGIQFFWCGPDQPGYIRKFNEAGLPAAAWDAGPGSVRTGIDDHWELINSRRYRVWKDSSPCTIDEYDTYHYPEPEDLKQDQDSKEDHPVKQNDHAMDANRGLTRMELRSTSQRRATTPNREKAEDQFKRLERLKSGKKRNPGTERFD